MAARIDFHQNSPKVMKALLGVESYLQESGLDPKIRGFIQFRVSQINGCAFCVNMHFEELKKLGVPGTHLNLVSVWKESPCFSDKERAALGWAEAVTLLVGAHVSDEDYDLAQKHFSDDELVALTVAIGQINLWNRMAISFKSQPNVAVN